MSRRLDARFGLSDSCTILVVDDDSAMRSLLVDELSEYGCSVIESPDGFHALSQIKTSLPNLIITDLNMPGGGFEYLQALIDEVNDCPIIVITAFGNSKTKFQAKQCGVTAYFDKPVRVKDLKTAVREVCPMEKTQACQINVMWDHS